MDGAERFEAAYEAHLASVLAFAIRRVPRHEAEDIVAETFAVAWRRRDSIPDPSLPWLYGVARHVIRNQERSSRRVARLRGKLGSQPSTLAGDPAESVDELDAFAEAFARLNEGQREILRLVAWEGLDHAEAAAVLECSRTAFRVRLHRARSELTKRMDEAGHVKGEMPPPAKQSVDAETE